MESSAKYTLVGAFVLVSAVLFVAAVFWISEVGGQRNTEMYTVFFRDHTLDGLQVDSAVTMKGIKVGTVADYHISSKSVEEVKVTLRLVNETPVKQDTEAVLKRNLLTGLAFIDLVGSSDGSPLLDAPPPDGDYPVIPEGQSKFEKIADSIPGVLSEINEMIGRVSAVLSEENVVSIEKSLKNVELVTASLASKREQIESILSTLEKTASDISAASKALKTFAGGANESLDDVSAETIAALKTIRETAKGFDERNQEMTKSIQNAADVFAQEVTAVSQRLAEASETFSKTVEGFENPRGIITGPSKAALGPGEQLRK